METGRRGGFNEVLGRDPYLNMLLSRTYQTYYSARDLKHYRYKACLKMGTAQRGTRLLKPRELVKGDKV